MLSRRRLRLVALVLVISATACSDTSIELGGAMTAYRDRMTSSEERGPDVADRPQPRVREPVVLAAQEVADGSRRAALLTGPNVTYQPPPADILAEIPDPSTAERVLAERLAHIERTAGEARVVNNYRRVTEKALTYLERLRLPQQRELSLAECIQRAVANNYTVRIEGFNPAIARTQLVEAEAAFDASFFLDSTYQRRDNPTASQLQASGSDLRSISGGIRKLLPSGMRTSVSLQQQRQYIPNFQFQQLNPAYSTAWVAEFTQPLMRGFGVDYNRSAITLARLGERISAAQFEQRVRETLLRVEMAYWQLSQARRDVMILAESVAHNHVTYQNVYDRREHDATPVEIESALSRLRQREVRLQEVIKQVRDAEDRLKNLLNDPELLLSREIEIIPVETPLAAPLLLDQFAEVRAALDGRSEIRQARWTLEQSRVRTMVAKNETMPQLDLSFSYQIDGLGSTADNSFDNLTTTRFQSYTVQATFSYPIGNRAAESRLRAARLRESQALTGLNQVTDGVIEEVNRAVRELRVRYEQIPTQLDSVRSAENSLRAFQARTQTINPPFLDSELASVEQLSNTRSTLLALIVQYNIAVVELESAKGALLDYNNVVLADAEHRR